jgi:hypothetical protein
MNIWYFSASMMIPVIIKSVLRIARRIAAAATGIE